MAQKTKPTPKSKSNPNPYRIEWETAENLDPVPTLAFFTKKPTDADLFRMLGENPTVRIADPKPVDDARCTYRLESYGPWVPAKQPDVDAGLSPLLKKKLAEDRADPNGALANLPPIEDLTGPFTKDPKRVLVQLSGEAFAKLAARARKKGVLPGTEAKVIVMAALGEP